MNSNIEPTTNPPVSPTVEERPMLIQADDLPPLLDEIYEETSNGSECSALSSTSNDSNLNLSENVFDAYHEIRKELKHSLKAFENNNLYLSNKLNRLQQEIKALNSKKELQQKVLVDLQIKVEELDQMKQLAIQACLKDRQTRLEHFNQQLDTIFNNDLYLMESQQKINELLHKDQESMSSLLKDARQEHENQVKTSQHFKNTIDESFVSFCERIQLAIQDEEKIGLELDEALEKCKNSAGLKEKYEYELQEKFANLKLIEGEVDGLKAKIESCKKRLNEASKENMDLNTEFEKNKELHSNIVKEKEESISNLRNKVEMITKDLTEKEIELRTVEDENKRLTAEIEDVESRIGSTIIETNDLTKVINELKVNVERGTLRVKELENKMFEFTGVHQVEDEMNAKKKEYIEKLLIETSVADDRKSRCVALEQKRDAMKTRLESLDEKEEELKKKKESAEKQLLGISTKFNDFTENYNLNENDVELNALKSKSNELKQLIEQSEGKLQSGLGELNRLQEEKSALDRELESMKDREEEALKKMDLFSEEKNKLLNWKTKIEAIRERIREMKASQIYSTNVGLLEEELKQVEKEITGKNKEREAQKTAIELTMQKTAQNLQEQMDKLKEASEEQMRKRRSRIENYKNNLPQLQQEVSNYKAEIVKTTEESIALMKERLKITGRIVESYNVLQNSLHSSNIKDFTTIRLLGTIEEHLASSLRGMVDYLKISQVNMTSPSYFIYRRTLDAFDRRLENLLVDKNSRLTDPEYLAELKTAALCLFGLRHYNECPSAGSGSFFDSPSSSTRDS